MVKIQQHLDPTIQAMDAAIYERQNRDRRRPYLGMSSLGNPCQRQLWYGFRWAMRVVFDAHTLKLFADGHRDEDVTANLLRGIKGITLITVDIETGRQIGYEDFGGHLRGHADGIINGIINAPKADHIWEHKCSAKQRELVKAINSLGEKNALKKWNYTYYAQHILYMHYEGINRGYLTCSNPGGRGHVGLRTNSDPQEVKKLQEKAKRIIFSDQAPDKISEDPSYYICKWCDFSEICHGTEKAADRNCRTCMYVTPTDHGTWRCDHRKEQSWDISYETQEVGCTSHRYNPSFVPGEVIEFDAVKNHVVYAMKSGTQWVDK